MKEIHLNKGRVAIVDDEDFEWLSAWNWSSRVCKNGTIYACRWISVGGKEPHIHMHREIMKCPDGLLVDHKDRDGLNNRRENLRIATKSQNNANNAGKRSHSTNAFKGVARFRKKWRAVIRFQGVRKYLGYFKREEDAARAYDAKARELFGEFASTNFPLKESEN